MKIAPLTRREYAVGVETLTGLDAAHDSFESVVGRAAINWLRLPLAEALEEYRSRPPWRRWVPLGFEGKSLRVAVLEHNGEIERLLNEAESAVQGPDLTT